MVPKWYIAKDKQRLGPFPANELKQMAQSGQLLTSDMVLKEGTEKWLPAAALKELFATAGSPPPPTLAPPPPGDVPPARRAPSGGRLWLSVTALVALLAVMCAGWFFVQSWQYQARLGDAEDKLRLLAGQKEPAPLNAGNLPPKSPETDKPKIEVPSREHQEQIAQLQAELQKLKEKGSNEGGALDALQKNIAQLQLKSQQDADALAALKKKSQDDALILEGLQKKSQQDALALAGLITSLGDFQKEILKKLDEQVKQRIAELDKNALLQEETVAALRKDLAMPLQDEVPRALIDKYALVATPQVERSIETLAKYLTAPFRTDKEKVRSIFRWMTDRISYNLAALAAKDNSKQSAEDVLANRTCVCAGYANLFAKLCQLNDLEAMYISGEAGSSGAEAGAGTSKHAWNAVKIQGNWQLVDVTWAAGTVSNKIYKKNLRDAYFLSPPELMILGHLPNDPQWQLLQPPLSEQEVRVLFLLPRPVLLKMYEAGANAKDILQQALKNESFRANLQRINNVQVATLQKLGMLSGTELLTILGKEKFTGLVTAGIPVGFELVQVHKAPLSQELQAGTVLAVELSGMGIGQALFVVNGKPVHMTGKGNKFAGSIVLPPGEVKVAVMAPGEKNIFRAFLHYTVVVGAGKTALQAPSRHFFFEPLALGRVFLP